MTNVIVAFSKPEDARGIKNILMRSGFQVIGACSSGAQALAFAEDLGHGIIVCGLRLADMMYSELYEYLPEEFSMLLVASPGRWTSQVPEQIICLPTPLKVHQLVGAMEDMAQQQGRIRKRRREAPRQWKQEERDVIERAKLYLMKRSHLSEEEAHRYLQKSSMESGTNLFETAQMLMRLMEG